MADISRRFFLAGSAALSSSALLNQKAQAASLDKALLDEHLAKLIEGSPQFLIFGDTDHRRTELRDYMCQEKTIATLAAAGVKHILLEFPVPLQDEFDGLASGSITREECIDDMKHMTLLFENTSPTYPDTVFGDTADLILTAKKYGIKVEAVDQDNSLSAPSNPTTMLFNAEISAAVQIAMVEDADKIEKMSVAEVKAWAKNVTNDYVTTHYSREELDKMAQNMLDERMANDQLVAKGIQALVGQDKAVIFYGAHHGANFVKYLGKDKTLKIALMPEHEDKAFVFDPKKDGWLALNVKSLAAPEAERPPLLQDQALQYAPAP